MIVFIITYSNIILQYITVIFLYNFAIILIYNAQAVMQFAIYKRIYRRVRQCRRGEGAYSVNEKNRHLRDRNFGYIRISYSGGSCHPYVHLISIVTHNLKQYRKIAHIFSLRIISVFQYFYYFPIDTYI